jgi:hypothetical protein
LPTRARQAEWRDLDAAPSNSWARWLAGPFDGIFSFHSANVAIAVNWGIAAIV